MIAAQLLTFKAAFAAEGDNMIGFKNPDAFTSTATTHFHIYILIIIYAVHKKHYSQISHFLFEEQAKQQQECLQNVFDSQPDGVIILSKPLEPKKLANKK